MGLISQFLGNPGAVARAATDVAEVFVPNATKKMEAAQAAYVAALDEHGEEFKYAAPGTFDRLINGLNRLPRPMLALGTLGLFVYAMVDPDGFSRRMIGLEHVPEPLWWLLAAIVGFYFGAREAHYFRIRPAPGRAAGTGEAASADRAAGDADGDGDSDNPALSEIRRGARPRPEPEPRRGGRDG